MTDKLPLSIFIIAFNESDRIGETLARAGQLADDIVVVDSGSTDGTQDIAARLGARVMAQPWLGYGPQKRVAEEACNHNWVLNLDADEVLSDALIEEIREVFRQDAATLAGIDGYMLRIKDCLPGEKTAGRFAHTTVAVRLYNKTRGRYAQSTVHDRVHFEHAAPNIRTLHAPVWHHSIRSIAHAIEKLNRYSTMQAADMKARSKFPRYLLLRLYSEFFTAFLKSYFLRLDVLRGHRGFINSVVYAFSRFARMAKVFEMQDSA